MSLLCINDSVRGIRVGFLGDQVLPRARASSGVAWGGRQLRMGVAGCDKMAWRHAATVIKTTRCKAQPMECTADHMAEETWALAANAIKTTRCKVQPIECIYADHMAEDTHTLAS